MRRTQDLFVVFALCGLGKKGATKDAREGGGFGESGGGGVGLAGVGEVAGLEGDCRELVERLKHTKLSKDINLSIA